MGFVMLPIVAVLFWLGITAQALQLSQAVPGAGVSGHMESLAGVTAQQAQVFGAACSATAGATPGLVGQSIVPSLPSGVVLPAGAVCMATARSGGGRDIIGYMPVQAGAAGEIIANSEGNLAWYRVQSQGSAINLVTGLATAVPAAIPVGALLHWVQTNT